MASKPAPGRYCLRICYCGQCPHYEPFKLSDEQIRRLTNALMWRSGNPNIRYHRPGRRV